MSLLTEYEESTLRLMYMSCWAALFFVIAFRLYSRGIFLKAISVFVFAVSAWVYVLYMRGVFFGLLSYFSYIVFLYWISERRRRFNEG